MANDLSAKRAYGLAARAKPIGCATASLLVICHHAQTIPAAVPPTHPAAAAAAAAAAARAGGGRHTCLAGMQGMYDRILCDVPCSGDGTLRKDLKVSSQLKHVAALTNALTHPRRIPAAIRYATRKEREVPTLTAYAMRA